MPSTLAGTERACTTLDVGSVGFELSAHENRNMGERKGGKSGGVAGFHAFEKPPDFLLLLVRELSEPLL